MDALWLGGASLLGRTAILGPAAPLTLPWMTSASWMSLRRQGHPWRKVIHGPQARRDDAIGGNRSANPAALAKAYLAGTFWRFPRTDGAFGYLSPARLFGGPLGRAMIALNLIYGFGVARFAPLALLIFTALSG
jgi:hypothetical protein